MCGKKYSEVIFVRYDTDIILGNGTVKETSFRFEDTIFTLMHDNGFMPVLEKSDNGGKHKLHKHFHYEMWYFNFETELLFSDKTVVFHEGEMLIIPPNIEHTLLRKHNDSLENANLFFNIKCASSKSNIPLYKLLSNLFCEPYFCIKAPKSICELIKYFDNDNPNENVLNALKCSLFFYEIIVFCMSSHSAQHQSMQMYNISTTDNVRAYKILMMIERYSSKKLTIDKIANVLSLSTRQTRRIIEDMYGLTFKEVIVNKRMQSAAVLLQSTDMTVSDIAAEVGYNSQKGFYNTFHKYYGCTPREYRKNYK